MCERTCAAARGGYDSPMLNAKVVSALITVLALAGCGTGGAPAGPTPGADQNYGLNCEGIAQGQPHHAICCLAYGITACAPGNVCAALDGRTVPACYAEGVRLFGQPCNNDRLCTSGDCDPYTLTCGEGDGTVVFPPPPAPDAGMDPPPVDPWETPSQCTSGMTWTGGNQGSFLMHPGGTCLTCHEAYEHAPTFSAAGTLYPTAHEPTDCNGYGGKDAVIEITDANKKVYQLTPNTVGNFILADPGFTPPYTVKVLYQGRTRQMFGAQVNGDCNSCHSQNGSAGAPGRILLP
jgi:hypothetical protein